MAVFEYTDGETHFEAYLSGHEQVGERPCVLVAHAWDGPNGYFNQIADEFAKKGFVGFAIDIYGKGVRGKIDGDNSHLMNPLLEDRGKLQRRLLAAFTEAQKMPNVNKNKIFVIGWCFGGLCALDLARAAPSGLVGAIAIHAPLHAPASANKKISASVLVLHGWEDPVAKPESVLAFAGEMTEAQADWQMHAYGHAKHAFTFVGADLPTLGIKYDEKAHHRSQAATEHFLAEILKAKSQLR